MASSDQERRGNTRTLESKRVSNSVKSFKVRYTCECVVTFDSNEQPTEQDILSEANAMHAEMIDWEIKIL